MHTPHSAFSRMEHRPWPVPADDWAWRQSWLDLLFAHWPVPTRALRDLVPRQLEIQEFDGTSWVGIVPFRMSGVAPRPLIDLPWFSAFPELNLRLYVERDGKPGVWFLSLDATNPLAVWGARRFFHLPYFRSRIEIQRRQQKIRYDAQRKLRGRSAIRFEADYGPTSAVHESQPGTLEHFLTERYCLYAQSRAGELYRCDVHHVPWPLQQAAAEIHVNELAEPHGFELAGPPALLHFARRLDVAVWSPVRVA